MNAPFDLSTYHYPLTADRIAQKSAEPRDHSRLMIVHRATGQIEHRKFYEIQTYLRAGDLLIANNSQVIKARFFGKRRDTRGKVEVFLLRRLSGLVWECLYRGSARPKMQVQIDFGSGELTGTLQNVTRLAEEGVLEVEFDRDPLQSHLGHIPLPPYVSPGFDNERGYETIYASAPGSVAAPTAGFHWTAELLERVQANGVDWGELTLHVGLGTFRPIQVADIRTHAMHEEFFEISNALKEKWERARGQRGRRIAVGTTSVRALESAFESGSKTLRTGAQSTKKFITPGYHFEAIDALITNFHLPESTLLVLVSAFAGLELTREAYAVAIKEGYRFYSFGDAMLVL